MFKKYFFISLFIWFTTAISVVAQELNDKETKRIEKLQIQLESLRQNIEGLSQTVDFNVSDTQLSTFVRAVGKAKKVNLSVTSDIQNITLTHNFSNAKVKDIILYLCKEHILTFDITGNIIALKKYSPIIIPKRQKPKDIFVDYDNVNDLFSVDLKSDTLSIAFKKITDITGKNLVFSPGLGNKRISGYIKNKPFKSAMDKLAFSNNLIVTQTKDGYYLFEGDIDYNQASNSGGRSSSRNNRPTGITRPRRYQKSNFFFKVIDSTKQIVEVDFENTPISSIIKDLGNQLNINMFTNAPLTNIGNASVKANRISYENLLSKILEDSDFTFKNKNNIFYFGKNTQASLRSSVVIPLMHRSIEVMNQPISSGGSSGRNNNYSGRGGGFNSGLNNSGSSSNFNTNGINNNSSNSFGNNRNNSGFNNQQRINTRNNQTFGSYNSKSEALINILPKDITSDLEIKTDIEHNTFIVSGDTQKIEKLKTFINKIDKPVPVVLIEVMILEISNSSSVSTGIDLGLGEKPVSDSGSLFPSGNLTLGAKSINKIIGGFNGFGSLNVGKVVPNFFAKIQLMETNGDVKVRSTPKLSTLNGHQATLSNGERSYYKVERTDVIGAQNPQTIQTSNFIPIDADLTIGIKPIVSGDQQITLSINVMQSAFNDGDRIDPNAPPGMNIREFTSTVRVGDQDVVILGGLEENKKNSVGSGVPLLARIPVIKWLFSKRTRTASKSKLSVLIKPTIIR